MKTILRNGLICSLFLSFCAFSAHAQEDTNDLLKGGVQDAKKLVGAYMSPFMKSMSVGLTQGWYNTAKPHKIAGVDLTITVNAMVIPDKDAFYNATTLGLQEVSLDNTSDDYPNAPTIFGPDREPTFRTNDGELFDGPPGLDLKGELGKNWLPVPMAQLGFGLPKNTDLKFRFIPAIDLGDDAQIKMIGFGVMHDVKQHIPGIKHLPFDLSGFVGYTNLKLDYKFDESEDIAGDNQRGEFAINATTIQGLISKKFSVLTLYGGLGYNIAKSNLAVKGTFDIDDDGTIDNDERDPLDLKYAASGPRLTAGFRLKLAVFTLHADYTLQKYNSISAGFGINVR